jgi:hypothetical protein
MFVKTWKLYMYNCDSISLGLVLKLISHLPDVCYVSHI